MSADNRTPHTDALATLGMLHTQTEGRDAIHLGVEQVTAGETLERGQPIGFLEDGKVYGSWLGCDTANEHYPKCVGIVDPFLDTPIYKGQKFWLVVLPRQITSLRHVWEYHDFKPSGETGGAQLLTHKVNLPQPAKDIEKMEPAELRQHIKAMEQAITGPTPEQLHQAELLLGLPHAVAEEHIRQVAKSLGVERDELVDRARDYVRSGSYWVEGGRFESQTIGDPEKFWSAYETVTGEKVDQGDRHSFLSCSC